MVVVLHLPKLGEPSCPFHAVGTQIRMSSGGVGEAVGELPPPSCITAGGQGTRGQGGGSPWPWGLGKPLQAVLGTGWGVRGWPWGCSEGMRALCPCARSPQLPPAAVPGAQGSIQYCKKFYFLYILLLYLQALNFSKIKALKRCALGCELGSACGTRLTLLRELGPPSAKRGPGAAAAVCSG